MPSCDDSNNFNVYMTHTNPRSDKGIAMKSLSAEIINPTIQFPNIASLGDIFKDEPDYSEETHPITEVEIRLARGSISDLEISGEVIRQYVTLTKSKQRQYYTHVQKFYETQSTAEQLAECIMSFFMNRPAFPSYTTIEFSLIATTIGRINDDAQRHYTPQAVKECLVDALRTPNNDVRIMLGIGTLEMAYGCRTAGVHEKRLFGVVFE